jgi:hypothetical protein
MQKLNAIWNVPLVNKAEDGIGLAKIAPNAQIY